MGKYKGSSMLAAYMNALPQAGMDMNGDDNVPLPDSMRASTLLEQIGKERSWTDDQIDNDLDILERNRLYYVRDLRALSNQSWTVIELLPLVRDLLRSAVDPEWDGKYNDKKMKEKKIKKKKQYGQPVVAQTFGISGYVDTVSTDPETIRNTIQNAAIDPSTITVPNRPDTRSNKSVSFDEQGIDKKNGKQDCSSSSSDSDSSCEANEDTRTMESSQSKLGSSVPFTGRPIQPISGSRIKVRTSSGQVYECDRQCPHKGVDLSTWGQVIGNTLVCTKHNWSFNLDGTGTGPKGRSVHPCRVNDW